MSSKTANVTGNETRMTTSLLHRRVITALGQSRLCDGREVSTNNCHMRSASTAAWSALSQGSRHAGQSPSKTWTAKLAGRLVVINTQRREPDAQECVASGD